MEDDWRKLREAEKLLLKKVRRLLGNQDGGDDLVSSVPASLKPRPSQNSGGVALPEPQESEQSTSEASWQKQDNRQAPVPKADFGMPQIGISGP